MTTGTSSAKAQLLLCMASDADGSNFRVCRNADEAMAFYKEMWGEDQSGGIQSQLDHFHDEDNWTCGMTEYRCDLYCSTFRAWRVDADEIAIPRSERTVLDCAIEGVEKLRSPGMKSEFFKGVEDGLERALGILRALKNAAPQVVESETACTATASAAKPAGAAPVRVDKPRDPSDSYNVMADAVCEIADAAREAFKAAGFDPGEWDSDNIVQDVKRGLVAAIEQLAAQPSRATNTQAIHVVEADVDAFTRSLRAKSTPWSEGCALIIESLWAEVDDARKANIARSSTANLDVCADCGQQVCPLGCPSRLP